MNGPQHYAEAERLLDMAETELEHYASAEYGSHDERVHLQQSQWATARAQVKATLALAAATIDAATQNVNHSGPDGYTASQTDVANGTEWARVISS
jgi:hypothetical protein